MPEKFSPLTLSSTSRVHRLCSRLYAALVTEYVPHGFRSHVFALRVMGLWPLPDDQRWYKWLTITFFLVVGILFPLTQFVNIFYANSMEEILDSLFLTMTHWANIYKAAIIYWHRNSIREVFRTHEILIRDGDRNATNNDRVAWINIYIHIILSILYFNWWVLLVVQIIFSKPFDRMHSSTSRLPYEYLQRSSINLTALMYQIVCDVGHTFCAGVEDAFYIALMNTTCGHVAELKTRLQNMGREFVQGENRNAKFYKDLSECCKRYENCLR